MNGRRPFPNVTRKGRRPHSNRLRRAIPDTILRIAQDPRRSRSRRRRTACTHPSRARTDLVPLAQTLHDLCELHGVCASQAGHSERHRSATGPQTARTEPSRARTDPAPPAQNPAALAQTWSRPHRPQPRSHRPGTACTDHAGPVPGAPGLCGPPIDPAEPAGTDGVPPAQSPCRPLGAEVCAFRDRTPAEQRFPHMFPDATYRKLPSCTGGRQRTPRSCPVCSSVTRG